MTESNQHLREYAESGSESAFRALVAIYLDLVYSVAVRRMGGDEDLAKDVSQTVFADLARKARSLPPDVMLGGWLHRHTCFVAATMRRSERRRQTREREAVEMNFLNEPSSEVWEHLGPVLDEAINELDGPDRDAVLLRFFERRDLRAVGAALGVSEDAAQKRVSRAVDKLREGVARRGVSLSVGVLATALAGQTVFSAPAGLAAAVGTFALGAAASTGGTALLLNALASLKVKLALAALVAAAVAVPLLLKHPENTGANAATKTNAVVQVADANPATLPMVAMAAATDPTNVPGSIRKSVAADPRDLLHLTIIEAENDSPMAGVRIEYRGWERTKFNTNIFVTSREGICDVKFPRQTITELELTTRLEGFGDTGLHWKVEGGDAIPSGYVVRLVRAMPIGGRVLDAQGQPVAGARVGFNDDQYSGASPLAAVETHEFGWIEVVTDANGRWAINRIAPEIIRRIYGSARHREFVDSETIFVDQHPELEKEMREGTHVFRLGTPVLIRGSVVDGDNQPVPDADVLVGLRGESGRREGKSAADGSFIIKGCKPGTNLLTADANGYAVTTLEVNAGADSEPFRLVLHRGNLLRLQVVNQSGEPVAKAKVWLDVLNNFPLDQRRAVLPQTEFDRRTDAEGRLVWTNAPAGDLRFGISARGFMRGNGFVLRADGEEHVVTLSPALVLSGTVRDAVTGASIPRFSISAGWPEINPFTHTTNASWSSDDRYQLAFANGTFRHTFDEPVVYGTEDVSFLFKFAAENYAPFVSRVVRGDEGEVQLEVNLKPAAATTVSVVKPDGTPAAMVEVGLVSQGARLELSPGGFSHQMMPGASLISTDTEGHFRLPPDEAITRVVVASPDGYGEVKVADLAADPAVHLVPWGRIEGVYHAGGRPAAGRELLPQFTQFDLNELTFDFIACKVKTDEEGKFAFPLVPPGKIKLARLVPEKRAGRHGMSYINEPVKEVEVTAGQTTTTTIGDTGYTVTARMRWPTEVDRNADWQIVASLNTTPPPGVMAAMNDPQAMAKWRQSPEFEEYRRTMRHVEMAEEQEGVLTAETVEPGAYQLNVMMWVKKSGSSTPERAFQGQAQITVPADPPTGSLDAGEIVLAKSPVPKR